MRRGIFLAALAMVLVATAAQAAGIDRRFGITGKAGALVPLQDGFISSTSSSDPGMAAGGGFIYGFGKCFAVEVDAVRLFRSDVKRAGAKVFEAAFTDLALGLQYRFMPDNRLVPFVGGGADFVKGELKNGSGARYDLDWTVGGHVNLGLDYFLTRGIALTADARVMFAADGDVNRSGAKVGTYDPASFIGTFGIRLFLPEHIFE